MNRTFFCLFVVLLLSAGGLAAQEVNSNLFYPNWGILSDTIDAIPTEAPPLLTLIVDLAVRPYIYNTFSDSYGSGMLLNAMLGVRFDKWIMGGTVSYDYVSFDGTESDSNFHGAGALLCAAFHMEYDLFSVFRLDAGIGSGWLASSYQYAEQGLERKDEVSLILYCTPEFKLNDWFSVKTPVRFQLHLGEYGGEPNVYAAGRAECGPFAEWLGLYAEVGFQPWVYSGSFFDTVSGLVFFSFGSHMVIPFGKSTVEKEVSR